MEHLLYRQRGKDGYYRIWHKPETNILMLVHEGSGSIVTRDRSYPMGRGTLCFIGAEKYHYTFPDRTENYVRSKLMISDEDLSGVLRLLRKSPRLQSLLHPRQMREVRLDEKDLRHAEEILRRLDRQPRGEFLQAEIASAVLQLTVLLAKNGTEMAPPLAGSVGAAVEYINAHLTEPLTVDDVCAAAYLSKYHFCRLFKERIGVTVMEYVQKTRIVMARELLSEGKQSVTAVSEACGFSSASYFSRAFKAETGMTPLQYKRRANDKECFRKNDPKAIGEHPRGGITNEND